MKVFLVICALLAVTVAQEPSLSCSFINTFQYYACELSINNPNGFNNFTGIGGIHLEGFTNADVNLVYTVEGTTTNIPQVICETFPNIVDFEFFDSQLREVDDNAFRGCSRIRQLYLFYNSISSISENAFENLRELTYINLAQNLLTTLPENLFANQANMTELGLSNNLFNDLPTNIFRPLVSLRYLYLAYCNINAINSQWFTTNTNLYHLSLAGNRLTISSNSFSGLQQLSNLNIDDNGINEIPAGTFTGLSNLQYLQIARNNFTVLRANSFPDLGQLTVLDIGVNPLETIDDDAFIGLGNLMSLYISSSRLRELRSNSFNGLSSLTYLDLNFNGLEDIPAGVFATMPSLNYIGLWNNRLKTLRRNSFGTLNALITLDLDGNIVNALERSFIDDATNLNTLYFQGNLCANSYFGNFLISRATYLPMLERCFENMRFIVDTTTEADGVYSFFDGPHPGIVLRVRSDNEVQIALTPFNFVWTPAIEIFIGSTNNTRSVIRVNEETDVVTVPTPNIVQQNQWNDFRITWANQNVLVFRANETYPFMSYTMQTFFPVNFYGLRAVESQATWSVQPFE